MINFSGLTTGIYKYIAIAGVVLAIAIGSYFYGVHNEKLVEQVIIAKFDQKNENAKDELNQIQLVTATKIITRYVTNTVHIKDVGDNNAQTIIKYVPDHEFLSDGWVYSHNAAAAGEPIDSTRATDATPSTTEANTALSTVSDNYTTCLNYKETAVGLQSFISGYNAAITKVNADTKKSK